MNISQALLDSIKSYLYITWTEEDADVTEMIQLAIAYFVWKGIDVDFEVNLVAKQLLKDRCRYVRNYRVDEFEDQFLSDIRALQISLLDVSV